MTDVERLAGQLDSGSAQYLVDQCQRDGVLRREVPAERAGRDVGDGGDLVDGRALEALPLAQFDGGVDQGGAGALFLCSRRPRAGSPLTSATPDANARIMN